MDLSKKIIINGKELKVPTVLSPMAGVTDLPFRRLIRELSKNQMGMLVSEFVSTDSCEAEHLKKRKQVFFYEEERPFGIQIFGRDSEKMAKAAYELQKLNPDFIEVNAGCPVPKVAGKGGGAGLLKDLKKLGQILKEVKKNISVPLSLKCRIGWDASTVNILETLAIAESENVNWLTIHGRTRMEGYRGLANWELIGEMAEKSKIPVIGNGDIVSAAIALEKLTKYNVSAISIGRGALHNPWIFLQIAEALKGNPVHRIESETAMEAFRIYYRFMSETAPSESCVLGRLKQLTARLCKGLNPEFPEFRQELLTSESIPDFFSRLDFFCVHEAENFIFEPERLINLNGQKTNIIEFGNQFK